MNIRVLILCFFAVYVAQAQIDQTGLISKEIIVKNDTIRIDSISLNPAYFKLTTTLGKEIDSSFYDIDFSTSELVLKRPVNDTILVFYKSLPKFLTKTYRINDTKNIVPSTTDISRLVKANTAKSNRVFQPFEGLQVSGNIIRGITTGNNQDAVVNSNLDLQISGNISENVQLRASITDNNIPIQENGYSQQLNEFDRVYIEMLGNNWKVAGGDINLQSQKNKYLSFTKKVAGIAVEAGFDTPDGELGVTASGALVSGKFAVNEFRGIEGNQGPYKINGTRTEQYILLISGSERIYVNGILLKRGENNDYTIDYNTAEITFNPTYPITGNMRIKAEYQFADRNYTRFVTFNGADYTDEKLQIGVQFYNENDAKNQPLQQDLTNTQKQIMANAGDDRSKMVVPAVLAATYEPDKILYKKTLIAGEEIFVFSTDETDELYKVTFTYVGQNNGNYIIASTLASGRVYEYSPPVNGQQTGSYRPVIQLNAPEKLQITTLQATYRPTERTLINTQLAYSVNDLNLYSGLSDDDNSGFAGEIQWEQQWLNKNYNLSSRIQYEQVHRNFRTVERFRNVEFSRNWNLISPQGHQQMLTGALKLDKDSILQATYTLSQLKFTENFNGIKHDLLGKYNTQKTRLGLDGSLLKNNNLIDNANFSRFNLYAEQHFSNKWVGAKLHYENNTIRNKQTDSLSALSHKFKEIKTYMGIGDTTAVFAEWGYNYSITDSVRHNQLQQMYRAHTYYVNGRPIAQKNTQLNLFANYRTIKRTYGNDEESFNARIIFGKQMLNNAIRFNTTYETGLGNLPKQEYSYLQVEPGMGYYTWIDYNENNVQELDEFEVALYQDQANYIRILLPSIQFIKVHRNKLSSSLDIHAGQWRQHTGFKKILSHFYNQTNLMIDNKKEGSNFINNINAFSDFDKALALNFHFKNTLFFNRGRQYFSTSYTYIKGKNNAQFSINSQNQTQEIHQLDFNHKTGKFWLFSVLNSYGNNRSISEQFINRNYFIKQYSFLPKISYLYSNFSRLELWYNYKNKRNTIGNLETLTVHTVAANLVFTKQPNYAVNANFNAIFNNFKGNSGGAVGYQLLEGLQPGTNFTWNLQFNKRITSYLDLNVSYLGRKTPMAKAVHTGSIQLRATF